MTSVNFNWFTKLFCFVLVGMIGLSFQPHFVKQTAAQTTNTVFIPAVFKASWISTLSEDSIAINFQDNSQVAPAGFVADYGMPYSAQEGRTFGWNISHEDEVRTRNMHFDPLLDTLIHVKEGGYWEIELDNGWYDVFVGIGDPAYDSVYTVNVEGTSYWNNHAMAVNSFDHETGTVQVTDGRLTVSVDGRSDKEVRLNYIAIDPKQGPDAKSGPNTIEVVLYNADNNQPIEGFNPLPDNAELDIDTLPGLSWGFVADVSGIADEVGSVVFSGSYHRTEMTPPYSLFGDGGDDIFGRWLTPGPKTLTLEAYSEANGEGQLLATNTLSFEVTSSNPEQPSGDCDQTVNNFDAIQWQANDVICLSQGTYEGTLRIGAEGVTVRGLGTVVLFGGRSEPLPDCGVQSYTASADHDMGIRTEGYSNLVIENLVIHGYGAEGIRIDEGTNNSLFRDLVIYDNGNAVLRSDGYWPAGDGIRLNGHNITIDRVRIFNNGEDQIQNYSDVSIRNLTISNSWLYNDRRHPDRDDSFNHCAHSDGLQIFDGGQIDGVLIENTYFSGLTQCVILGETSSGLYTKVNDVTFRDVVCDQASGMGLYSKNPDSTNWTLERVTVYCGDGYTGNCIHINGSNTTIIDSIIDGAKIVLPQGVSSQTSGNCQANINKWHDEHVDIGAEVELNYVNAGAPFAANNDFTLVNGGNCVGSQLTSVTQLQLK